MQSELGMGSTFHIYLPRADAMLREPPAPLELETLRGKETILVVEDEAAVRNVLVGILTRNGYRVIETSNGREALEAYAKAPEVDLVLTDVVMPVMSGRELAQRLKSEHAHAKILFMSGYLEEVRVLEPSVPLLSKPLVTRSVLRKAREALGS